jgi:hypothetical protein
LSGGIPTGGLDRPASTQGQQPQQVQVGLWWPAADPAKLRASAGAWRRLADDVEGVSRVASQAALQLSSQNQSEAVSAFEAYWAQRWTGGSGCLPAVAEAARGLSAALDNYAGAVEKAQLRIKELIAAVATAVVIGAVLTVVTIGVSDLAAGAVAGSLVAAAAAVGVELSAEAAAIITAGIFATSLGVLEGGLADLAIQGERVGYFHDQPSIDWNEVFVNAAVGGATAGASFGAAGAAPAFGRIAARLGGEVRAADAAGAGPAIRRGQLEELSPGSTAHQSEVLKDPALRKEHLYQVKKYGKAGYYRLPNGNFRYYPEITPARKPGRMIGTRVVREWNPYTGEKFTWLETLDSHGRVRIIRPQIEGPKVHYYFDEQGKYIGSR